MTLAIRQATPADIPAITRIYAHAVDYGTASFELTPPDEAEMTLRMNELLARKFPYLAAELDGALVGYAYAAPYRARPAYRFTVENSVYVAPDIHRRGVGKALLEALIEACTKGGFRLMIAVIGDSKQAASIGVHGRVRIGSDQCVGIGDFHRRRLAVDPHLVLAIPDNAREIFEVDLMADAGAGWDDGEVVE